ncbi:MAG: hypothetical protein M3044_21565 [Thermoproteota archaeon]|nr:hypothetical protein [Thermoproteota archaeon]
MGELLLGCSGWNYPDTADKGGWTGVFYPDKDTKRLRYYSQRLYWIYSTIIPITTTFDGLNRNS